MQNHSLRLGGSLTHLRDPLEFASVNPFLQFLSWPDFCSVTHRQIIGEDAERTGFGNSGTGIVSGPGQANLDLAVPKSIALAGPHDGTSVEIRAEFFNTLNHPQFANPDADFTSPTFGIISGTSVNARVGQVAVRFSF